MSPITATIIIGIPDEPLFPDSTVDCVESFIPDSVELFISSIGVISVEKVVFT